jgi:hypothetical protein
MIWCGLLEIGQIEIPTQKVLDYGGQSRRYYLRKVIIDRNSDPVGERWPPLTAFPASVALKNLPTLVK